MMKKINGKKLKKLADKYNNTDEIDNEVERIVNNIDCCIYHDAINGKYEYEFSLVHDNPETFDELIKRLKKYYKTRNMYFKLGDNNHESSESKSPICIVSWKYSDLANISLEYDMDEYYTSYPVLEYLKEYFKEEMDKRKRDGKWKIYKGPREEWHSYIGVEYVDVVEIETGELNIYCTIKCHSAYKEYEVRMTDSRVYICNSLGDLIRYVESKLKRKDE